MITTDLLTFELTFNVTSTKVIFNVSQQSINELTEFLREYGYKLKSVKQLRNKDSKFLKIPNQKLITILDYNTELIQLLTK